jgi:hypothetical protein
VNIYYENKKTQTKSKNSSEFQIIFLKNLTELLGEVVYDWNWDCGWDWNLAGTVFLAGMLILPLS